MIQHNIRAETKDIRILCTDLNRRHSYNYQIWLEKDENRKLLQGYKAVRIWRVQVQKERSGAYTRAPNLSGLYSPRNSQTQTAFVHDSKNNAINGVCYNMGQKESKTKVRSLHM
jgi:hypothetical protein